MKLFWLIAVLIGVSLVGCARIPPDVKPVDGFQLERYLGLWYEVARIDNSFERGLTRVTATYSLRPDGGVTVLNRGYLAEKNEWKSAEGRAYFVAGADKAYLKVSFFGPFYAPYVVRELDPNYGYALVTGADKSYLWILSRTPQLDPTIKEGLLRKAVALGFDRSKIIDVDQMAK